MPPPLQPEPRLVAVDLETKARKPWNPLLHPRDSKGRFIETGGIARAWGGALVRILKSRGRNRITVEERSGQRRNLHSSRLTMVARPDGSKPTRSKRKVQEQDAERERARERGDGRTDEDRGRDRDDDFDQAEQNEAAGEPEDDRDEDDQEEGEDEPDRRWDHPREVVEHWRSEGGDDDNDDARELAERFHPLRLSENGSFVVGKQEGKWKVFHSGTGASIGLNDMPSPKAALAAANAAERIDLDGEPFDWDSPDIRDRVDERVFTAVKDATREALSAAVDQATDRATEAERRRDANPRRRGGERDAEVAKLGRDRAQRDLDAVNTDEQPEQSAGPFTGDDDYQRSTESIRAAHAEWRRDLTDGEVYSAGHDVEQAFEQVRALRESDPPGEHDRRYTTLAEAARRHADEDPRPRMKGNLRRLADAAGTHAQRIRDTPTRDNEAGRGQEGVPDDVESGELRADRRDALAPDPAERVEPDAAERAEGVRDDPGERGEGVRERADRLEDPGAEGRGDPGRGTREDSDRAVPLGERGDQGDPAPAAADRSDRSERDREARGGAADGPSDVEPLSRRFPDAPTFKPESQEDLAPRTVREKARANIAVLRTLRTLQAEDRAATPDEQRILARWAGWGSLSEPMWGDNEKHAATYAEERAALDELMTPEEIAAARRNTLNAHYTDADMVKATWGALQELGFDGGQVLEPGSGSGNFMGFAPDDARMVGVELDPTTAAISRYLYPDATVVPTGIEDFDVPAGTFDAAIGNVPFSSLRPYDRVYNPSRTHNLHNLSIIKSLDKLRPGGVAAMITSSWTMDSADDSARRAMYDKADLVAAVRLPSGAHRRTAGSEVVTDLLVFRRRKEGEPKGDASWLDANNPIAAYTDDDGTPRRLEVNNYWDTHPGNVLGEMGMAGQLGMRGLRSPNEVAVRGDLDNVGSALESALSDAVAEARRRGLTAGTRDDGDDSMEVADFLAATAEGGEGTLRSTDDGFKVLRGGRLVDVKVPKKDHAKLKRLLELRDVADELLTLERGTEGNDSRAETLRAKLTKLYDAYVKKNKSVDYPNGGAPINNGVWRSSVSDKTLDEPRLGVATADLEVGNIVDLGDVDSKGKPRRAVVAGLDDDGRVRLNVVGAQGADRERLLDPDADERWDVRKQRTWNYYRKRQLPAVFETDPLAGLVINLEAYDPETNSAEKGALLRGRTLSARPIPTNVENPEIALSMVLDRGGAIDMDRVAQVMGVDADTARQRLTGLVFHDPDADQLVTREDYLSGDVRQKLRVAESALADDPDMQANVDALREALPEWHGVDRIEAKLGASWIEPALVQQFLREMLDDPKVTVQRLAGAEWTIDNKSRGDRDTLAGSTWGTERRSAYDLVNSLLHQRKIRITDTVKDGDGRERQVFNKEATDAAQAKAAEVAARFAEWLWEDPERGTRILNDYNDRFNSLVRRQYSEASMHPEGMSDTFELYPHQTSAIRRVLNEPAVLIAHEVGAGKTLEMASSAMELKRRGLAKKPMIVVPNHMKEQWQREFLTAFPQARVLAISSDDLSSPAARRDYLAKAATGDWDAVIITHSTFGSIKMSKDAQRQYIDDQLAEEREHLEALKARDPGGDSRKVKQMELRLANREQKLKEKLDKQSDSGVTFEQLGVDYLFVDEAHEFKNLNRSSHTDEGIEGSDMASDLDMKLGYLRNSSESSRYVTFATATPVSNSFGETHTMLKYLRPDLLEDAGVANFDTYLANFARMESKYEQSPDGSSFVEKYRIRSFTNAVGLFRMWQQVADVLTSEDLDLDVPDVDGDVPEQVLVPASEWLTNDYTPHLAARAQAAKSSRAEKGADNILVINNDGSAAALDPRMVGGPEDPNGGKIGAAADQAAQIYEETRDNVYLDPTTKEPHPRTGALQLVFLDMGTPGASRRFAEKQARAESDPEAPPVVGDAAGFEAYEELKRQLVARGIPEEKIAFMHDAKGDDMKKAKLFARARSGELAVLVGSTALMGVGTNVQDRAVALHHLDVPYRPSDLAQREGRAIRQKNQNGKVRILQYATEGSLDARKWEIQARKGKFIGQLMKGDLSVDAFEELSPTVFSAEEMAANSSGNPLLLDMVQNSADLQKVRNAKRAHDRAREIARHTIDDADREEQRANQRIAALDETIPKLKTVDGGVSKYEARVGTGGQQFEKRKDANDALRGLLQQAFMNRSGMADGTPVALGRFGGFEATATAKWDSLTSATEVWVEFPDLPNTELRLAKDNLQSADLLARLDNLFDGLPERRARLARRVPELQRDRENAEKQLNKPFRDADRLAALESRAQRLESLQGWMANNNKPDDRPPEDLAHDPPAVQEILGKLSSDADQDETEERPPPSSMANVTEDGTVIPRTNNYLRRRRERELADAAAGKTAEATGASPSGPRNPEAGKRIGKPQKRLLGRDGDQVYVTEAGEQAGTTRDRVVFNVQKDPNGYGVYAPGAQEAARHFPTRQEATEWALSEAAEDNPESTEIVPRPVPGSVPETDGTPRDASAQPTPDDDRTPADTVTLDPDEVQRTLDSVAPGDGEQAMLDLVGEDFADTTDEGPTTDSADEGTVTLDPADVQETLDSIAPDRTTRDEPAPPTRDQGQQRTLDQGDDEFSDADDEPTATHEPMPELPDDLPGEIEGYTMRPVTDERVDVVDGDGQVVGHIEMFKPQVTGYDVPARPTPFDSDGRQLRPGSDWEKSALDVIDEANALAGRRHLPVTEVGPGWALQMERWLEKYGSADHRFRQELRTAKRDGGPIRADVMVEALAAAQQQQGTRGWDSDQQRRYDRMRQRLTELDNPDVNEMLREQSIQLEPESEPESRAEADSPSDTPEQQALREVGEDFSDADTTTEDQADAPTRDVDDEPTPEREPTPEPDTSGESDELFTPLPGGLPNELDGYTITPEAGNRVEITSPDGEHVGTIQQGRGGKLHRYDATGREVAGPNNDWNDAARHLVDVAKLRGERREEDERQAALSPAEAAAEQWDRAKDLVDNGLIRSIHNPDQQVQASETAINRNREFIERNPDREAYIARQAEGRNAVLDAATGDRVDMAPQHLREGDHIWGPAIKQSARMKWLPVVSVEPGEHGNGVRVVATGDRGDEHWLHVRNDGTKIVRVSDAERDQDGSPPEVTDADETQPEVVDERSWQEIADDLADNTPEEEADPAHLAEQVADEALPGRTDDDPERLDIIDAAYDRIRQRQEENARRESEQWRDEFESRRQVIDNGGDEQVRAANLERAHAGLKRGTGNRTDLFGGASGPRTEDIWAVAAALTSAVSDGEPRYAFNTRNGWSVSRDRVEVDSDGGYRADPDGSVWRMPARWLPDDRGNPRPVERIPDRTVAVALERHGREPQPDRDQAGAPDQPELPTADEPQAPATDDETQSGRGEDATPSKKPRKGDEVIYTDQYGNVSRDQLAAYRKHNVSPSDHDDLVDVFGEDNHADMAAAVRDPANHQGTSFSAFQMQQNRRGDSAGLRPLIPDSPTAVADEAQSWLAQRAADNPQVTAYQNHRAALSDELDRAADGDAVVDVLRRRGEIAERDAESARDDAETARARESRARSDNGREKARREAERHDARAAAGDEVAAKMRELVERAAGQDDTAVDEEGTREPERMEDRTEPDQAAPTPSAEPPPSTPEPEQEPEPETSPPEQLPGEKFPPSPQQQAIFDAVLSEPKGTTKVEAKAGTGKTTTLEMLARRIGRDNPDERIAYIAFNKSVQVEAEGRMPDNTEPRTGHSLAYQWAPKHVQDRTRDQKTLRRADEVARHLGINERLDTGDGPAMSPTEQAMAAIRAVDAWANSADDEITVTHLPERVRAMPAPARESVRRHVQRAWEDLNARDGRLRLSLDHVRKMWALSRPDLTSGGSGLRKPARTLFLDEAQDTPPVLAKVVADQDMRKVIVGDADQAIYGFTGATDYLSSVDADHSRPLNVSRRFGPEVAAMANRYLEVLDSNDRVVGAGPEGDVVEPNTMRGADAVLVRSNGGAIEAIVREQQDGRDVGVPKGTKRELMELVDTARYLQGEGKAPYRMHDDLAPFRTWAEVVSAANQGDDQKITMLERMVRETGVDELDEIVQRVTELDDEPLTGVTFRDMDHGLVAEGKTFGAKDHLKDAGFRFLEVPGAGVYKTGKNRGKPIKAWTAIGTQAEREAKLARARELASGPAPDVVVSTAHKAKGLEWDRVRIGDDFRGPKTDPETGDLEMPSPEELRLAYVAVTRAQKELDPGSLAWVYDYTGDDDEDRAPEPETETDAEPAPGVRDASPTSGQFDGQQEIQADPGVFELDELLEPPSAAPPEKPREVEDQMSVFDELADDESEPAPEPTPEQQDLASQFVEALMGDDEDTAGNLEQQLEESVSDTAEPAREPDRDARPDDPALEGDQPQNEPVQDGLDEADSEPKPQVDIPDDLTDLSEDELQRLLMHAVAEDDQDLESRIDAEFDRRFGAQDQPDGPAEGTSTDLSDLTALSDDELDAALIQAVVDDDRDLEGRIEAVMEQRLGTPDPGDDGDTDEPEPVFRLTPDEVTAEPGRSGVWRIEGPDGPVGELHRDGLQWRHTTTGGAVSDEQYRTRVAARDALVADHNQRHGLEDAPTRPQPQMQDDGQLIDSARRALDEAATASGARRGSAVKRSNQASAETARRRRNLTMDDPPPRPDGDLPAGAAEADVADMEGGEQVTVAGVDGHGGRVTGFGYTSLPEPVLIGDDERPMFALHLSDTPGGEPHTVLYTDRDARLWRREPSARVLGDDPAAVAETLPGRLPVDRNGDGVFPGAVVTGRDGATGMVVGVDGDAAEVEWSDGSSTNVPGGDLAVAADASYRLPGFTPDGVRPQPGNVVESRDGTGRGVVQSRDGDTVTVDGEERSAAGLRVLARRPDMPQPDGQAEPIPARDIEPGDRIVLPTSDRGPLDVEVVDVTHRDDGMGLTKVTFNMPGQRDEYTKDLDPDTTVHRTTAPDTDGTRVTPAEHGTAGVQPELPAPVLGGELGSRVAQPVLTPAQRAHTRVSALETPNRPEIVREAATKIRYRRPLSADEAQAAAEWLRADADRGDLSAGDARTVQRIANRLDAAAAEARGDVFTPPDEATDVEPQPAGEATVGDWIALPNPDGTATIGQVKGMRWLAGDRLVNMTIRHQDGGAERRLVNPATDTWRVPDLPDPQPLPDTDAGLPGRVNVAALTEGDRIETPDGPQTVLDVSPARTDGGQPALQVDMVDDHGQPSMEIMPTSRRVRRIERGDRRTAQRAARRDWSPAERDLARRLEEVLTQYGVDLGEGGELEPEPRRERSLLRHLKRVAAMVGAVRGFIAAMLRAIRTVLRRATEGLRRGRDEAEGFPGETEAQRNRRVARMLRRTAPRMIDADAWAAAEFDRWATDRFGPRWQEGDLPTDPAEQVRVNDSLLPADRGNIGNLLTRATRYGPIAVDQLRDGHAPSPGQVDTWMLDTAPDGGPGYTALRHLAALRGTGRALTREIDTKVRARFDDDPYQRLEQLQSQEADLARQVRDRVVADPDGNHDDVWQRWRDSAAELRQFDDRIAQARRDAALDVLGTFRALEKGSIDYGHPADDDRVAALRAAERVFPQEWLTLANKRGVILGDNQERGEYDPVTRTLRLSNPPDQVALHELAHVMETVVPGLVAAQRVFLYDRTSAGVVGARTRDGRNRQTPLTEVAPGQGYTPGETTRPDDFPDPYTGREYNNTSFEVFAMGLESLLGTGPRDEDLEHFVLGALLHL